MKNVYQLLKNLFKNITDLEEMGVGVLSEIIGNLMN
jgi:hypothetical protein